MVVVAMVKVDASVFAGVAAVAAAVLRNWIRFSLLRVPLYERSDTCLRRQRILSLFGRRHWTDCEACRTTADSGFRYGVGRSL